MIIYYIKINKVNYIGINIILAAKVLAKRNIEVGQEGTAPLIKGGKYTPHPITKWFSHCIIRLCISKKKSWGRG